MKRSGSAIRRIAAGAASAVLMLVVGMLLSLGLPSPATAQARCAQPAAFVRTFDPGVRVLLATTNAQVAATRDMPVCAGDTIQVAPRSRASVFIIASNTLLTLDQNSQLEIVAGNPTRPAVNLLRGALLFITRIRRSFEVRTPFVNASVEGTEFVVRVGADSTTVTVMEGRVRAANDLGFVDVNAGQAAIAAKGQAPQLQLNVRPRDAVQWALYYEPIVPADSFAQLDAIPATNQDAAFFVRRAGLLLSVGQLDAARSDVDQAEKLDPNFGDVYALRTIAAVALNQKTQALESGRAGVKRAPNSVAAQLALSYALQANFQLEEARDVTAQAVTTSPDSAAAWARLAELRLMLDDLDGGAAAADRAVSLAPKGPEGARPRVVRGFSLLARLKVAEAEQEFQRALDLQIADPLAHLGLGLSRIRRGRLATGRADLELAVALSPDNAILRSYLGKAYFDEARDTLAGQQFASAKQIDPLDPTAFYYDAIRQQAINRPVESMTNLEEAIRLNGNRSVYRSRLLLDQDLAARQAGLGRVYRDLGLEELALAEGWKSVQADGADHAGHRFLADTYSALPRHEVARVSELLQAQLLQPISLTPVPPRLAETDLFILQGSGPDAQAFNEFNPLFNRNRVAVVASGVGGQNGVLGNEITVSGVRDRLSFSVGQFHYSTDGFRINNYQDRDIQNAFVQAQISKSTSVMGEVRFDNNRIGDLTLLFDPEDFSPNRAPRGNSHSVRAGVRHEFGPRSVLIGSIERRQLDTRLTDHFTDFGIETRQNTTADIANWSAEVRHLFRAGPLVLNSGFGRFQGQSETDETLNITNLPFEPFEFNETTTLVDEQRHTNLYAYPSVSLPHNVTVTAGASVDFYRTRQMSLDQVNPKFGVTWSPTATTTIRAASIRTLHRTLVSRQTIEPTHVAGFNQFFEESGGTDAWRHGLGVDQKLPRNLFAGAEYSWRDLRLPVLSTETTPDGDLLVSVIRDKLQEQLGRAYAAWLPHPHVSVSAKYVFERFDRQISQGAEHFFDLHTHRVPFEVRYFAPQGLFGRLAATRVFQRGVFSDLFEPYADEDRFWVVDATVGFRIPRHYGRLALEMMNLFNQQFRFQDTDPANPRVRPSRLVVLSFTVGM